MYRYSELCRKRVVKLEDGEQIGRIGDIETENGRITAIVIPGKYRLFGLLGRAPETVIPWELVKPVGKDVIILKFS